MEQRTPSGLFIPEDKSAERQARIESDARRAIEIASDVARYKGLTDEGSDNIIARLAPEIFKALQK